MADAPHRKTFACRFAAGKLCLTGVAIAFCLGWGSAGQSQTLTQDDASDVVVPKAPEDGGPRRWSVPTGTLLSLRSAPSAGAPIIGLLAQGTVLSSFGCLRAEGQAWCEVRHLREGVRGFAAADALEPAAGPDGRVATGLDDSADRARRQDFDARGRIACAQERDQDLGLCTAMVARSGGGDATVVVTFSNGFARSLYFVQGAFIGANATMSGTGKDVEWQREADLYLIRVDDQRYSVPDSFIFGE